MVGLIILGVVFLFLAVLVVRALMFNPKTPAGSVLRGL